ncbi:hypothetical protein IX317_002233 [Fusobacterium sp. DD29]|uniref:ribbon-helix-helix protein, CopG family n=1 Tax=unclassified Fusobacterium TaxID=2648384 RepID=UPI001B8B6F02|nr:MULTISPECIES: ribbon-helix-helix protein, CopG family [unclassified Fusobacterium]MBR8702308.1 hypothetical protein [Fusobacterium sp. DD45]MBR8712125.1 hypothetical protein [Fusobacterium sp. DD28]MBR8750511.1 hypothetical protein [Fusobacterium sp. DD29]MBR8752704.1 hypothetical protein [Fusobacterium sp. DD26]MBR8762757.1 hypothetical protein [Fusobacterium sp. DD25]
MEKKVGRPTDNPKVKRITVRLDQNTLDILDRYCKENNIDRGEGVRQGIRRLANK